MKIPVKFRPYQTSDEAFVFKSWLNGFRLSPFAEHISNPIYFTSHHKIIEQLLEKSEVMIACNPEDSDHIYGYAVGENAPDKDFIIHWAYVKESYRGLGICRELVKNIKRDSDRKGFFTHYNCFSKWVGPKLYLDHNPYLIFNL